MERILTVTQLNEYVRRSLAVDPMLKGISLQGEISNFKRHSAGHLYFTLKDAESRIACVMFRTAAMSLHMLPSDGMRVVAVGSAALYTAAGQYQFYVDTMRDDGVGALYVEFERRKAKLLAEGLFDQGLKKPLPLLPRGVGIVTSQTGAVVHDIQMVAQRRNPGIQLYLWPSAVQGEEAAREIVDGIAALDRCEDIDVIIIGRGGGSLEDLWAFNEEAVARAIFHCKTPVISAVGHETDITIADFVADVRAATPSHAAELAIPRLDELQNMLREIHQRMNRMAAQYLVLLRHRLGALGIRLSAAQPANRLLARLERLTALRKLLDARMESGMVNRRLRLDALKDQLESLSPQRVLLRGYALVTTETGIPVTRRQQTPVGSHVHIQLHKGVLAAMITEAHDGKQEKGH